MTAHTAKGQEEEAVVVLDASERNFPKIHPDNLLYEIFDVTPAEVLAEERRLFYVAVSRAGEMLWILTEANTVSQYVKKIRDTPTIATNSSRRAKEELNTPHEPSAIYLQIQARLAGAGMSG